MLEAKLGLLCTSERRLGLARVNRAPVDGENHPCVSINILELSLCCVIKLHRRSKSWGKCRKANIQEWRVQREQQSVVERATKQWGRE